MSDEEEVDLAAVRRKPRTKPARKAKPKMPKEPKGLDLLRKKFENPKLRKLAETMRKKWGEKTVHAFDDGLPEFDCVSTGLPSLDAIIDAKGQGRRGIPRGFYTEISGPNASGKTWLFVKIASMFQRLGLSPGLVNIEGALDLEFARAMDLLLEHFFYVEAKYGERALVAFTALITKLDLVGLDSWGALYSIKQIQAPKRDTLRERGPEPSAARRTALVNQCLLNAIEPMDKQGHTLIGINQVRDKFGGFSFSPEKGTTGGNFLKHFQVLHLAVDQSGLVKVGDEVVGRYTFVKVKKSKIGPLGGWTKIALLREDGFSTSFNAVEHGLNVGVLKKKGSWVNFGKERLGQGKMRAKEALDEKPALLLSLLTALAKAGPGSPSDEDGETYEEIDFEDDDLECLEEGEFV